MSRTRCASSQFSAAVQPITSALASTPTTPTQEPRSIDLTHRKAGTARRTQSQPLFGPSTPLRVTWSWASHVQNTPMTTATIATRTVTAYRSDRFEARRPRTVSRPFARHAARGLRPS